LDASSLSGGHHLHEAANAILRTVYIDCDVDTPITRARAEQAITAKDVRTHCIAAEDFAG